MCNCNNTTTTTQNHVCKPKCPPQEDCTCPVQIKSSCVTMYDGNDLECSGIESGLPLNQTIELLDNYICEAIDEISTAINLVNVGTGEDIYAGIDGIGRRKIKRVNTDSNILTITPNTDDITFSVDESALNTFIEANQKTYSVANVGTDPLRVNVYKDSTIVGDNTQFNFRTVVQENQGTGESFLRDIQQTTDELKVRVKTLVSDNLTITATDEEVRIETPMTASIPALYVNNLYEPTYQEWLSENSAQNGGVPVIGFVFRGKGTLAQPFTDSIVYPLAGGSATITPNTAIQNALDGDAGYTITYSYVGNDTRLSPNRVGEQIIIQDNTTFYNFPGDFEYTDLNLKIEGLVDCTTAGYLIDMDNSLNIATPSIISIEVLLNRQLEIFGEGFKNNGTTVATTNYVNHRQIRLVGEGVISFTGNDINKYLLSSDKDSVGNTTIGFNNDGAWQFEVGCYLVSEFQGLVAIGGISQVLSLGGTFQTGTVFSDVDVNLKAFNLKGGSLRVRRGATIIYYGSNLTSRLKLFTLEPTNSFTPALELSDIIMAGNCETLFSKENNGNADINITSSGGAEANSIEIFDSTNLWSVNFRNNLLSSGNIDFTKVDLTQGNNVSSVNTIGHNIVESLVIYNNRAAALLAGRPLYSAYLKTSGVAYPTTAGWVRDIVLPA